MATPAETVGAIATTVFLKKNLKRSWGSSNALFQILATEDLNPGRLENIDKITPVTNTTGKAESYKWSVSMTAPNNGGTAERSFARGGTFDFDIDDRLVPASATPKHYAEAVTVPTTDIDVHTSASDNENMVSEVVAQMDDGKFKLLEEISTDLTAAASGANTIVTLLEQIDATGTASGIAQGTHANWAANEIAVGGRLTLQLLSKTIRDMRRSRAATLDCIIVGAGVYDLLVQEAEAKNTGWFDIVQHFGKNDKTGMMRLPLETSFDVIKVSNAIIVCDDKLDASAPTVALGLSLKDIFLYASKAANFEVKPWEDVSIPAAIDQTRALIRWSGFTGVHSRRRHVKFTGCATA